MAEQAIRAALTIGDDNLKSHNFKERKAALKNVGGQCKQWRLSHKLRLCDITDYGISVQSLSNFEWGLNDSALALFCYVKRGFQEVVNYAP